MYEVINMARVYIPTLKPIPNGATKRDRVKLYNEYKEELIRTNPNHFNTDGSQKTVWQWLKGS